MNDRFIEALNKADEIMDKSISKFGHLRTIMNSVENLTKPEVNYIRSHISDAYEPLKSSEVLTKINKFFHNYGVAEYTMLSSNVVEDVDDLPF